MGYCLKINSAPRPLRLERVSNFARPKLSNFARSKSLTLNFGQQLLISWLTFLQTLWYTSPVALLDSATESSIYGKYRIFCVICRVKSHKSKHNSPPFNPHQSPPAAEGIPLLALARFVRAHLRILNFLLHVRAYRLRTRSLRRAEITSSSCSASGTALAPASQLGLTPSADMVNTERAESRRHGD